MLYSLFMQTSEIQTLTTEDVQDLQMQIASRALEYAFSQEPAISLTHWSNMRQIACCGFAISIFAWNPSYSRMNSSLRTRAKARFDLAAPRQRSLSHV
jgi:hypothetical protein